MEKCPKCGSNFVRRNTWLWRAFECGTNVLVDVEPIGAVEESQNCLRRQLAQSEEKRDELKAEYDLLLGQLAAANERAGRYNEALADIKTNHQHAEYVYDRATMALEVPDA